MASRRSGYSKMYMVPPSIWELVKKCVDEFEMQRLNQLNMERALVPVRTRGDQILSNISSQDIGPLDRSYRSRSDILESTLAQPSFQEIEDEFYQDPSMHSSDRSRSRIDPDISSQTERYHNITMDPARDYTTISVDPTDISAESEIDPIIQSGIQQNIPGPSKTPQKTSIFKPSRFKRLKTVHISEPSETRQRIKPAPYQPRFSTRTRSRTTPLQYGQMSPANPSVIPRDDSFFDRSSQSLDRSRVNFDPLVTSTPIPVHRMPTIPEQDAPIPIPILPLPGCEPKTPPRIIQTRSRTRRQSPPRVIQTRSRTKIAIREPHDNDEFKCSICNKLFSKKIYLNKHMQFLHKINVEKSFDKWRV